MTMQKYINTLKLLFLKQEHNKIDDETNQNRMTPQSKSSMKRSKPSYFMAILGVALVLFILGMEDCKDKLDGMMKTRAIFNPSEIYFCDDRPSPLKKLKIMISP
jgi:hypothetical protein